MLNWVYATRSFRSGVRNFVDQRLHEPRERLQSWKPHGSFILHLFDPKFLHRVLLNMYKESSFHGHWGAPKHHMDE